MTMTSSNRPRLAPVLLLIGLVTIHPQAALPAARAEGSNNSLPNAFSIQQRDGIPWLIRPDGRRFFSLGVCCVSQGASREKFDPDNPGYAAWQHYQNSNQWAEATLDRLQSWGFSTVGAWSDFKTLRQCSDPNVAFAPVLHIGSTAGAPWWDMWDPKITDRMEQVARDQILSLRDDPRLMGYYSDNEMGWWNATLFKMTLEQPPTSGQRQRLLQLLRDTYRTNWSHLQKDFDPEGATTWDELDQRGMLYLRPGGGGIQTMRRFLGMLAERYYFLVHQIIRKYDRRALILGERYQSFYYPEVARASSNYLDAISSNLNAGWNDGTFARFYLDTLHALTGKPIIASEFYMAARQNRSGNKNSHGVFPVVTTQKDRAAATRVTLEALLKIPYVIGADWFQYHDEPTHGRYDGENFNFGLVDIHDRPYETLVSTLAELNPLATKTNAPATRPNAAQGVPPAPANPFAQFKPMLALRDWDRERGFIKPSSEFPLADMYICWNKESIYLGLYAQDVVESAFYRDKFVPKEDRAEWIVSIPSASRPIRARLGAGAEPIIDDRSVRIVNLSGVNLDTRNIAALRLPAALFGRQRFKAGDTVEFSATFFTHCRAYRVDWNARFPLSAK